MDLNALKFIGIGLGSIGMLGASIGVGLIFAALLQAISRNPSAIAKMEQLAYIGAGLAEAMGLFAFLISLLLIYSV